MTGPGLTPEIARWLCTSAGRERVQSLAGRLEAGEPELRLASELRTQMDPARAAVVIDVAHASRQRGDLLATTDLAAQASPGHAAAWRARRFAGAELVADLCTGAGADARCLKAVAPTVGVEREEAIATLARHNLAGAVDVVVGDALAPPVAAPFVHADPARRFGGGRRRGLGETRPATDALLATLGSTRGACVLVAPGVDLADPALPTDGELEFIQGGRSLVECAIWLGELRKPGALATATLLHAGESLTRTADVEHVPPATDPAYLIDPAPALVRARLHDDLARRLGAGRLTAGRAMLASRDEPARSPWYSAWRILGTAPARRKQLRALMAGYPDAPIEIRSVGAGIAPDRIWQMAGRPDRGPAGRRLFVVQDGPVVRCYLGEPSS